MTQFTRRQLYEAVWAKSAVQLGKEIGVSDVAIAKACKRYNIPKPPLGYWARVQHGQRVPRPPLPKLDDPYRQTIRFEPVPEHLRAEPMSDETMQRVQQEKADEKRIVVPEVLGESLPLVERTRKSLSSVLPDQDGIVRPKAKGCLEVAIGPDSIDRAMRIMNSLLAAMIARGMKVRCAESNKWSTLVHLDGEVVALRLSESLGERARHLTPAQKLENARYSHFKPHAETEKHPKGLLALTARGDSDEYVQKRWSELEGKRLEERLNAIVAWTCKAAEQIKTRRIEAEERRKRWAEEERLRREAEQRRWEEEQKLKQLEEEAAAWRRAQAIRAYADAAERATLSDGEAIEPESDRATWLRWARGKADEIDPLAD